MELESKALDGPAESREIKQAFDELLRSFETFKAENNDRFEKLARGQADVVTNEKVDRINAALAEQKSRIDELLLERQRPALSVAGASDPDSREHKSAFERYVRKGDASGLDRFEMKSLSSQSDPDGGYLVPRETEAAIDRVLAKASPIRAISSVRQIGRCFLSLNFRRWNSMPCRRRRRVCSMMPSSMSRSGSLKRYRSPSQNRKAQLSSMATA